MRTKNERMAKWTDWKDIMKVDMRYVGSVVSKFLNGLLYAVYVFVMRRMNNG